MSGRKRARPTGFIAMDDEDDEGVHHKSTHTHQPTPCAHVLRLSIELVMCARIGARARFLCMAGRVSVLACMAVVLAASAHGNDRGNPGGRNRTQPDFDWDAHCGRLNQEEFRRRYRLTAQGFYNLLDKLWPKLNRERKQKGKGSAGSGKGAVKPHTMLAVTLRFFAGGSPLDLKLIYGMRSRSTVYKIIWLTVDAINDTFKVDFPIQDTAFLSQKEAEFRAVSTAREAWVGQVGAVDGVHFKTSSPGVKVKDALKYYVQRKAEYALLCIAVCDANRRFTFWDQGLISNV